MSVVAEPVGLNGVGTLSLPALACSPGALSAFLLNQAFRNWGLNDTGITDTYHTNISSYVCLCLTLGSLSPCLPLRLAVSPSLLGRREGGSAAEKVAVFQVHPQARLIAWGLGCAVFLHPAGLRANLPGAPASISSPDIAHTTTPPIVYRFKRGHVKAPGLLDMWLSVRDWFAEQVVEFSFQLLPRFCSASHLHHSVPSGSSCLLQTAA